jgi:hypothetical protein
VNELGEEVVGKSDFIDEGQTRGENRQFGGFWIFELVSTESVQRKVSPRISFE